MGGDHARWMEVVVAPHQHCHGQDPHSLRKGNRNKRVCIMHVCKGTHTVTSISTSCCTHVCTRHARGESHDVLISLRKHVCALGDTPVDRRGQRLQQHANTIRHTWTLAKSLRTPEELGDRWFKVSIFFPVCMYVYIYIYIYIYIYVYICIYIYISS